MASLRRHRDTEAAQNFLTRLLGDYDVTEVIHTDQLRSDGAAIREMPRLADVDHQSVVSTARCNNNIEQEHRSTRRQERFQQGVQKTETRSRIPELTRLDHQPPALLPNWRLRINQKTKSKACVSDVVCGCSRDSLNLRPPLPLACHANN